MDALLSALIVIGLTLSLSLVHNKAGDSNEIFLYQIAQDAVEVCSKKNDLSSECFSIVKKINPAIAYCLNECENYSVVIKRNYPEKFEFGIRVNPE